MKEQSDYEDEMKKTIEIFSLLSFADDDDLIWCKLKSKLDELREKYLSKIIFNATGTDCAPQTLHKIYEESINYIYDKEWKYKFDDIVIQKNRELLQKTHTIPDKHDGNYYSVSILENIHISKNKIDFLRNVC